MQSSLIGLGGAIIGILLGHFLTRSSQHKQWLRDNRKQEFKELVTAMSTLVALYWEYRERDSPEFRKNVRDAVKATVIVMKDRIYIHADIKKRNILVRFTDLVDALGRGDPKSDELLDKALKILEEVIEIAKKG